MKLPLPGPDDVKALPYVPPPGQLASGTIEFINRAGEPGARATAWCGRPNARKGQCRGARVIVSAAPWYERVFRTGLNLQWEMGGCKRHLTEAEETFISLTKRLVEYEETVLSYKRENDVRSLAESRGGIEPRPPECWSWYNVDLMAADRGYKAKRPTTLAELEEWHQGRCAICGRMSALVRDHCHWSGLVRGLLCRDCNRKEARGSGIFSLYRQRHPALMFGLRIPYRSEALAGGL